MSRFARNALSSYGLRLLLALNALALPPYLFRTLGPAGFGTWSVIFSTVTIPILLQVAFSQAVAKRVADLLATGSGAALRATVRDALGLMAIAGVVLAAGCALVGLLADGLAAAGERGAFQAGMLLLAAAMLVRLPAGAYGAVLVGYQRYDLYNASWAISTATLGVGAVVAVELGWGVLGVAGAFALSTLVDTVLFVWLAARLGVGPRLRAAPREPGAKSGILGFGSLTALIYGVTFVGRMDVVIVAALRGAATAAPLAAAAKLQSGLQSLVQPIVELLMPMTADLAARGEREEVQRRFTLATRLGLQVVLPVAAGVALFSTDLVDVWLGGQAPGSTDAVVALLMAGQVLIIAAAPAEKVLIGLGRVRGLAALAVIEGVGNIALTVILVAAYGVVGAAVATLTIAAAVAPVKLRLTCRAAGASPRRLATEGIAPAAMSAVPSFALMALVWLVMEPGAARLAAGLGLGVTAAMAVALFQVGPARAATSARSAWSRRSPEAVPVSELRP